MSDHSKISVLMAYYNNTKHVEESIRSVYAQTYKNIELIVVDDCSPDPVAVDLIRDLQNKYGFRLFCSEKNQGASKAFQKAFEASEGDYIAIISHDDLYVESKLEHSMRILIDRDLDAVYCNGAVISDGHKNPSPFDSSELIAVQTKLGQKGVADLIGTKDSVGSLLTQGALYTRKVFESLSWVRDKFLLDDWPFTIKVWRDYKVFYDDAVVYLYRHHANNVHKDYWRWFPARVQTVCELVDEKDRLEVLSFLLINLAESSIQNNKENDALRLAFSGLMMTNSQVNSRYAVRLIRRRGGAGDFYKSIQKKLDSSYFQSSVFYRFYARFLKILIGFLPIRRLRRKLRTFLNV